MKTKPLSIEQRLARLDRLNAASNSTSTTTFDLDEELDKLEMEKCSENKENDENKKSKGKRKHHKGRGSHSKRKSKDVSSDSKEVKRLSKKEITEGLVSYLNDRANKAAKEKNERLQKKHVKKSVSDIWEEIKMTFDTKQMAKEHKLNFYFKSGSAVYLDGWTPERVPKKGDTVPRKRKEAPSDGPPAKRVRVDEHETDLSDEKKESNDKNKPAPDPK